VVEGSGAVRGERGRERGGGLRTWGRGWRSMSRSNCSADREQKVIIFGAVVLTQAYLNTGFWLNQPCCVAIDRGRIWFGSVQSFLRGERAPEAERAIAVTA
jgi:hypothetical protein